MAASATFALKAGVWFRRGRLLMVSPDSLGTACPLSGRNSTYRPVQISGAGSDPEAMVIASSGEGRAGSLDAYLGKSVRVVIKWSTASAITCVGSSIGLV